MHAAFDTWNEKDEPLESVERRIHDGVQKEQLRGRAQGYIHALLERFPWAKPKPQSRILEVGSGVGYILEAALRQLDPAQIVGLDVAEHMIRKAKDRLQRDGALDPRISFVHYDGIRVPLPDNSFDYIYSVAAIQHIPKPFAYHLFYEIFRLLKPNGFAALHTLSVGHLPEREKREPFYQEVLRQVHQQKGHWHHFYSFDELFHVLVSGVGVDSLDIQEGPVSFWFSFGKGTGEKYRNPDLPRLLFSERRLGLSVDENRARSVSEGAGAPDVRPTAGPQP